MSNFPRQTAGPECQTDEREYIARHYLSLTAKNSRITISLRIRSAMAIKVTEK
jgi:hypothetical protein